MYVKKVKPEELEMERVIMEMDLSNFYWLTETMFKLHEGEEADKIITALEMAILMS
jgi:hypothetical protein